MAAALQASGIMASSTFCQRGMIGAVINLPRLRTSHLSLPKLPTRGFAEELADVRVVGSKTATINHLEKDGYSNSSTKNADDPAVIAKLYEIMEIVADRVEMHKNIGEQRNNWNSLLLTSINTITLTAATMAGIAATVGASSTAGAPLVALKLSSTLMYVAATGLLMVMNKIQPSQLVEEQRNSARLFKQIHRQIQTTLSLGNPTAIDVKEAIENVVALDKAYPLPLLGAMLDKFPKTVEPAVWWPQQRRRAKEGTGGIKGKTMDMNNNNNNNNNGWNEKMEEEMREVVKVLKRKDIADYMRLSKIALKFNKILATSGPLLTGVAAIGSAFVGSPSQYGTWAATVGIVAGALASVVNTVEHGGQVGMVFEMYRSSAGFFKLMEESIESNLNESDVEKRDNGELFEMKVALQLGRSLSELKHLKAASPSSSSRIGEAFEEFASKLF